MNDSKRCSWDRFRTLKGQIMNIALKWQNQPFKYLLVTSILYKKDQCYRTNASLNVDILAPLMKTGI